MKLQFTSQSAAELALATLPLEKIRDHTIIFSNSARGEQTVSVIDMSGIEENGRREDWAEGIRIPTPQQVLEKFSLRYTSL